MMRLNRKSGILLHISSLPSEYGIGDFGNEAYRFVDLLAGNGFSLWQILPLGPVGAGNSPYQAYSSYAGNPLFIAPDKLLEWKLLKVEDLLPLPVFSHKKVDYQKVKSWKKGLFKKVWHNFQIGADENFKSEFLSFLNEHNWWLDGYALYTVCKFEQNGTCWTEWPDELLKHKPAELEKYRLKFAKELEFEKFIQFMFFRQWFMLKNYANSKGIQIFGDLPLYVSLDSADVWGNQELFLIDKKGNPMVVGGVPPDYFSEDGQLWGNPLYNWDKLAKTNYQWWVARLYFHFHLFDLVRVDHFRGLESFWAIPAGAETAKTGEWMPAKGAELLNVMKSGRGKLPVVAEDLGIITPEVKKLQNQFNLPGMKVLQFAFDSNPANEHLPHNYNNKCVVYTGTHDNDTLAGWWNSLNNSGKNSVRKYLTQRKGNIIKRLIELAWSSTAEIAIVPLQDILELGSNARMNVPGVSEGNWQWRYTKKQLRTKSLQFIKELNKKYNRTAPYFIK